MTSARGRAVCLSGAVLLSCAYVPVGAQTNATITGHVRWVDVNGGAHPARRAKIEIVSQNGAVAATTNADATGAYSAQVAAANSPVTVRLRSESPTIRITPPSVDVTFTVESSPQTVAPGQTRVVDLQPADNAATAAGALSLLDAFVTASDYVALRRGSALKPIKVIFPTDQHTSLFNGTSLHLLLEDRWDWDVAMHEYGHYVSSVLDLDASPGGSHQGGTNLSETRGKPAGVRLAWGEGWPTFFGVTAQLDQNVASFNVPNAGDSRYQDTDDASIDYSLESAARSAGEDDELSVQRILFDVYDPVDAADADHLAAGAKVVWDAIDAANPRTLSDAVTALRSTLKPEQIPLLGLVLTTHAAAPKPTAPADQQTVTAASAPTFQWTPQGGGPKYRYNSFTVEFYDEAWARVFTSPVLTKPAYTPGATQWQTILGSRQTVRWVVSGSNTAAPRTGPYPGPARTLNRKP